ncbi:spondin-1-like, partial [Lampetra fluviatilis]
PAVDCQLSPWSPWSPCSVACGRGVSLRLCVSLCVSVSLCLCVSLSVDCQLSPWSPWSPCSVACGRGVSLRTRLVETEPRFHGSPCPQLREDKRCRERRCRTRPAETRRHRVVDTGRETRG